MIIGKPSATFWYGLMVSCRYIKHLISCSQIISSNDYFCSKNPHQPTLFKNKILTLKFNFKTVITTPSLKGQLKIVRTENDSNQHSRSFTFFCAIYTFKTADRYLSDQTGQNVWPMWDPQGNHTTYKLEWFVCYLLNQNFLSSQTCIQYSPLWNAKKANKCNWILTQAQRNSVDLDE